MKLAKIAFELRTVLQLDFFRINYELNKEIVLVQTFLRFSLMIFQTILKKSIDPVYINGSPKHCLMYAGDIILLSTSAEGLQSKLNVLEKYCEKLVSYSNPRLNKNSGTQQSRQT